MVVQHNLLAMNSNRMLNVTTKRQAKSTEKLSSGYRINRAADDAAGLSISEKMRKQIRGLTQASANAQDGISMVQIADGAMAEVDDMLHRMNELTVKAANGTLSKDDRNYIQDEVNQLVTEIDRVATTTKFNETFVLQGSAEMDGEPTKRHLGDFPDVLADMMGDSFKISEFDEVVTPKTLNGAVAKGRLGMTVDFSSFSADDLENLDGKGFSSECMSCNGYITIKFVNELPDSYTGPYTPTGADVRNKIVEVDLSKINPNSATLGADIVAAVVEATGGNLTNVAGNPGSHNICIDCDANNPAILLMYDDRATVTLDAAGTPTAADGKYAKLDNGEVKNNTSYGKVKNGYDDIGADLIPKYSTTSLHVGADSTKDNKIFITLPNMSTLALGLKKGFHSTMDNADYYSSLVNVKTAEEATKTIDIVSNALQYVSTERSRMGAYQNRLEHTIANLDNVVENTTAAESAIRDTDMATEMVSYSNNNILAQAGQAMLAQANQSNQGVLSLLQ